LPWKEQRPNAWQMNDSNFVLVYNVLDSDPLWTTVKIAAFIVLCVYTIVAIAVKGISPRSPGVFLKARWIWGGIIGIGCASLWLNAYFSERSQLENGKASYVEGPVSDVYIHRSHPLFSSSSVHESFTVNSIVFSDFSKGILNQGDYVRLWYVTSSSYINEKMQKHILKVEVKPNSPEPQTLLKN
jgi:hypothetical protein